MNTQNEKRLTVRLKCPNPLFEEWLITWRDQAAAKDSKMQYTFNNALKSLRKYPLPFESGRECKILKGFGDKLCKMLDEKLREYTKTNGSIEAQNTASVLPYVNNSHKASQKTNRENRGPRLAEKISNSNRVKDSSKEYIPQFGSGAYAILVTLYRQSLQPDYEGFLKKEDIINHGKDLVNASFTKPDPGSRYTAWSSMRTLLTKNLVSKISHPPKFSLTEEGKVLAKKLHKNTISKTDSNNLNNQSNEYSSESNINIDLNKKDCDISQSYDILEVPEEFSDEFWECPRLPDNDTFSAPESHVQAYNDHEQKLMTNEKFDSCYVKNGQSLNNVVKSEKSNKITASQCLKENEYLDKEIIDVDINIQTCSNLQHKPLFQRFLSSPTVSVDKPIVEENIFVKQKSKITMQEYSSNNTISSTCSTNDANSCSKISLKRHASSSSTTSIKSTASVYEHFVMAPHSFDIILYVDTNETSGSSNSENDDILVGLKQSGIKYEVKSLKVGDFTWVCRDRLTNKELVLPYIIERKRMDDFAHSIRDKRYYEQKFRLKRCGIENLTYLVESHGRNQHYMGLPLQSLYQAATNTAIQENFFIKFTDNIKETVEYLVTFSRMLTEMFKAKTLASCIKDDIQPTDINSDLIFLMSFKEFNESSVKNKRMTVTDLFIKMLIQIKGMSVERALAITQKYPTPMLLKIAYDENPDVGEKLLSNIKYGTYSKSLGIALSKTVYQVFNKMQY